MGKCSTTIKVSDLAWSDFDGLYLFNPFFEHVMTDPDYWIDDSLPNDTKIFDSYVQSVQTKLKTAKAGTKVVTYHGFGGDFPPGYSRILKEQSYTGYLELWVKEN